MHQALLNEGGVDMLMKGSLQFHSDTKFKKFYAFHKKNCNDKKTTVKTYIRFRLYMFRVTESYPRNVDRKTTSSDWQIFYNQRRPRRKYFQVQILVSVSKIRISIKLLKYGKKHNSGNTLLSLKMKNIYSENTLLRV